MMMNYKQFYDRISGPLRPYTSILDRLNKVITRTFYLLFPIFLSLIWLRNGWFVLFTTVLIMGIVGMLVFIPIVSVLYALLRGDVYEHLEKKGIAVDRESGEIYRPKEPDVDES